MAADIVGGWGFAVPVKRALESGSYGGGARWPAGWWSTGLGPLACGGVVGVCGPRKKEADREGFVEIGFWPFSWWVVGEGYFILSWLFM